jgi:glycosyltransferase involved in cell wall biosynthesis
VAPDLVQAALATPADLYIAHYDAALPAAAAAARRHGACFAFDAEDYHPGDLEDLPQNRRQNDLIQAIEALYLPGCSHITAGSPGIADAYANAYGIHSPRVILNVFPKAHAPSEPTPRGSEPMRPSIYWFSQTIGLDRGLQAAIRAIATAATRPHLFLRGSISPAVAHILKSLAKEMGVSDRLHFLQPAPPDEMVRRAAEYDIGIVGETGVTHNRRIALTNKQFTYLLAGIPTLMSDVPAHRQFASELGEAAHLYAVDDDLQLAQRMDYALENPSRLAAARKHAWRLGQERYNWDREKQFMLDLVANSMRPLHEVKVAAT